VSLPIFTSYCNGGKKERKTVQKDYDPSRKKAGMQELQKIFLQL